MTRGGEENLSPREQRIADLATVASFLVWCEADGNHMFGARTALETLAAFSRITGISMDDLAKVAHAGVRGN
jgi:hypothetical protein